MELRDVGRLRALWRTRGMAVPGRFESELLLVLLVETFSLLLLTLQGLIPAPLSFFEARLTEAHRTGGFPLAHQGHLARIYAESIDDGGLRLVRLTRRQHALNLGLAAGAFLADLVHELVSDHGIRADYRRHLRL